MLLEDILRYGKILWAKDFVSENATNTVRIISIDGKIYVHHMRNGVVLEVSELGGTEQ